MGFSEIVFISTVIAIVIGLSTAYISCEISPLSNCGYTDIIHLYRLSNSHAELPNQTNAEYSVCCRDISPYPVSYYTDVCDQAVVANLFYPTDSHVELANETNYPYKACFGAVNATITCNYRVNGCESGEECLFTINGGERGYTNAHIGDCITDPYPVYVCCDIYYIASEIAVSLENPLNNNYTVDMETDRFYCIAGAGSRELNSISLYHNYNGILSFVDIKYVSGQTNSSEWTLLEAGIGGNQTYFDGGVLWNCKATDTEGISNFAPENYTFSSWGLGQHENTQGKLNLTLLETALEGNYTSRVFDYGYRINWTKIEWMGSSDINIYFRTRDDTGEWLHWRLVQSNPEINLNDSARYFQYRAELKRQDAGTEPYLRWVEISFVPIDWAPEPPESVLFSSPVIFTNESVQCYATGDSYDENGDEIIYYFKFNKTDGTTVQDWSKNNILDCESMDCNAYDRIICWAKATTTTKNSTATPSEELYINNTPPSPPIFLIPISSYFSKTIEINCSGAEDLDNHTLYYNIEAFYDNAWHILQNHGNGSYRWDISGISDQVIDLRCCAWDGNSTGLWYNPEGKPVIDNTPPDITLVSPKNRTAINPDSWINISVSDSMSPISTVLWSHDNITNSSGFVGYYNLSTENWTVGDNYLIIWAEDLAGNWKREEFYFYLPGLQITIDSPVENSVTGKNTLFDFTVNRDTKWVRYSLNNGENITVEANTTHEIPCIYGLNNLTVWAEDIYGYSGYNWVSWSARWCGDGHCDSPEDCSSCSVDCGSCPKRKSRRYVPSIRESGTKQKIKIYCEEKLITSESDTLICNFFPLDISIISREIVVNAISLNKTLKISPKTVVIDNFYIQEEISDNIFIKTPVNRTVEYNLFYTGEICGNKIFYINITAGSEVEIIKVNLTSPPCITVEPETKKTSEQDLSNDTRSDAVGERDIVEGGNITKNESVLPSEIYPPTPLPLPEISEEPTQQPVKPPTSASPLGITYPEKIDLLALLQRLRDSHGKKPEIMDIIKNNRDKGIIIEKLADTKVYMSAGIMEMKTSLDILKSNITDIHEKIWQNITGLMVSGLRVKRVIERYSINITGVIKTITLVRVSPVFSNTIPENVSIIEIIPKSFSDNVDNIFFTPYPSKILARDPIVVFEFNRTEIPEEIIYCIIEERDAELLKRDFVVPIVLGYSENKITSATSSSDYSLLLIIIALIVSTLVGVAIRHGMRTATAMRQIYYGISGIERYIGTTAETPIIAFVITPEIGLDKLIAEGWLRENEKRGYHAISFTLTSLGFGTNFTYGKLAHAIVNRHVSKEIKERYRKNLSDIILSSLRSYMNIAMAGISEEKIIFYTDLLLFAAKNIRDELGQVSKRLLYSISHDISSLYIIDMDTYSDIREILSDKIDLTVIINYKTGLLDIIDKRGGIYKNIPFSVDWDNKRIFICEKDYRHRFVPDIEVPNRFTFSFGSGLDILSGNIDDNFVFIVEEEKNSRIREKFIKNIFAGNYQIYDISSLILSHPELSTISTSIIKPDNIFSALFNRIIREIKRISIYKNLKSGRWLFITDLIDVIDINKGEDILKLRILLQEFKKSNIKSVFFIDRESYDSIVLNPLLSEYIDNILYISGNKLRFRSYRHRKQSPWAEYNIETEELWLYDNRSSYNLTLAMKQIEKLFSSGQSHIAIASIENRGLLPVYIYPYLIRTARKLLISGKIEAAYDIFNYIDEQLFPISSGKISDTEVYIKSHLVILNLLKHDYKKAAEILGYLSACCPDIPELRVLALYHRIKQIDATSKSEINRVNIDSIIRELMEILSDNSLSGERKQHILRNTVIMLYIDGYYAEIIEIIKKNRYLMENPELFSIFVDSAEKSGYIDSGDEIGDIVNTVVKSNIETKKAVEDYMLEKKVYVRELMGYLTSRLFFNIGSPHSENLIFYYYNLLRDNILTFIDGCIKSGDRDGAKRLCKAVIRNYVDIEVMYYLAGIKSEEIYKKEALEIYRRIIDIGSTIYSIYPLIHLFSPGTFYIGLPSFSRIQEILKDSAEKHAELSSATGLYIDESIDYITRYLKYDKQYEYLLLSALLQKKKKKYRDALNIVKEALKDNPADKKLLNLYSELYLLEKRKGEANAYDLYLYIDRLNSAIDSLFGKDGELPVEPELAAKKLIDYIVEDEIDDFEKALSSYLVSEAGQAIESLKRLHRIARKDRDILNKITHRIDLLVVRYPENYYMLCAKIFWLYYKGDYKRVSDILKKNNCCEFFDKLPWDLRIRLYFIAGRVYIALGDKNGYYHIINRLRDILKPDNDIELLFSELGRHGGIGDKIILDALEDIYLLRYRGLIK